MDHWLGSPPQSEKRHISNYPKIIRETSELTPSALGEIFAKWNSEDQATFLVSVGHKFRSFGTHRENNQLFYLASELVKCDIMGVAWVESLACFIKGEY